jgi:hypothetical protein
MPFALTNDPSQSEISEAINYLLANFGPNLSADPNTGQITGPSGIVIAYLYRYLSVKYADSFDGSLNFSNSPTGRGYYGVNNSDSTTESTNPADYIWYKVAGGFGTTKFLFYQCNGGRQINFVIATTAPSDSYVQDAGTAIDLDILTSGAKANSATTAYLVQSQSSPAPSGFPLYTSGSTLPPGWSATIGTVAVGQVVWYSFGQYNGSTSAVNGVPANSTYWSTPVAASVFQDLKSDNWNGSTPPTYGVPSTYGTVGYYIRQGSTSGNPSAIYINNGIFSGVVQSGTTGNRVVLNESSSAYFKIYDSSGNVIYSLLGVAGLYTNSTLVGASAISAFSVTNASGYNGTAITATALGNGHGVQGVTNDTSGVRNGVNGVSSASGSSAAAVYGSGDFGLYSNGKLGTNNSTQVTNLNANYLQGNLASAFATTALGTDAYAANRLNGSAGTNVLRFVQGTVTGSAVATFTGTNKPGSNSSAVWIQIAIDGTTFYIPAWT